MFLFKSTTVNAISSSDGAIGTVIMATDYNASNVNFSSKIQMLDSEYCTDSPPTKDIIHCIEEDPKKIRIVFFILEQVHYLQIRI